jgi:hypothetical protein
METVIGKNTNTFTNVRRIKEGDGKPSPSSLF